MFTDAITLDGPRGITLDVPATFVPVKGWTPCKRKNGAITLGMFTPNGARVVVCSHGVVTECESRKAQYAVATSPQIGACAECRAAAGTDSATHGAPRKRRVQPARNVAGMLPGESRPGTFVPAVPAPLVGALVGA